MENFFKPLNDFDFLAFLIKNFYRKLPPRKAFGRVHCTSFACGTAAFFGGGTLMSFVGEHDPGDAKRRKTPPLVSIEALRPPQILIGRFALISHNNNHGSPAMFKVIKKDNTLEDFAPTKIVDAIKKAAFRCDKVIADEATTQRLIAALEEESLKYETYFKLIIATGMRRGECCGLQWGDINWQERSIHIQRNVVKVTGEDIIVKETKTVAGDRYVYFSLEMESLLKEFQRECAWEAETYDNRKLEDTDYIFRRHGYRLPMTPTTFTWRFKLILKKHGLPTALNVHSLRHTNASLLIAGGADVATVAGLLGHSQPSTTLDIYTHAFDKNKKAASQVLQEGLEI